MALVLLVEDAADDLQRLRRMVEEEGCEVETAVSLDEARQRISARPPDLVLSQVSPGDCGVALLKDLDEHPSIEVVLTTGKPTIDSAIAAVRLGAFDYLVKPIERQELRRIIAATLGETDGKPSRRPARALGTLTQLGELQTVSSSMRRVFHRIERVAPTDVTVLVTGESGTGKELVAQTIHQLSSRSDGPFLAINCGAVAPSIIESELFGHEKGAFTGADRRHAGYFERTHDGTLLLDEITEMPADLQVKLLRVLETGKVIRVGGTKPVKASPRIIAASNRDPEEAVAEGALREDLFYRLRVFPIRVPPLRSRGVHEIAQFATHFLAELNRQEESDKRFTEEALAQLQAHDWPGNVRELRNAVEAAFVLAEQVIDPGCLSLGSPELQTGEPGNDDGEPEITLEVGTTIADAERELILTTLEHLDGDKPAAAKALGISLKTLYNRLKSYREDGSMS